MPKLNRKKAEKVRDYVRKWDNQWRENITLYHEMYDFIMGEQWVDQEEKLFDDLDKIPLTVNILATQLNHLLGEQRQNTPNLQIEPDDDVPAELADVRSALVKEISLNSDTKTIYQNAFEQAACGGFGAWWAGPFYPEADSFLQEIGVFGFRDPTKCFWDIGDESICKTKGMYSGFRTTMSRSKFAREYGSDLEKKIGFTTTDVENADEIKFSFSDEQSITVINLFERKSKMDKLYQLSNNEEVNQEEFDALERREIDGREMLIMNGEPVTILKEKSFPVDKIVHSKWAGDYELEKTDFPSSKNLPVVYLDQHSYYDRKGRQIIRSFFKGAKDSQRYLNYLRTQCAYIVMTARYDQFMVSKQNVRSPDTEQTWNDPSQKMGALYYDESPSGAKPEQLTPPELSQSLIQQYEAVKADIQNTTGIYDTQMGDQGNEVSGVAIDARTQRGNYNTFLPKNSLDRALGVTGELINEMIPKVYDTHRVMRLEMKDTGRTKVAINEPVDEYGTGTRNDMTVGKYKIRIIPGASIESVQTEGRQSMDMILSKSPDLFHVFGDLYADNVPWANRIELRNRIRATIDPAIIQAGKTGQPLPPKPPQQDPMIAIKQQEIQMKMQQSQMKAQNEIAKIQLEEKKLIMDSHNAGVNYATELQKLQVQKDEAVAQLASDEKRYQAEMARIAVTAHLGHASNITSILTHQPNKQFGDEINDAVGTNTSDAGQTQDGANY